MKSKTSLPGFFAEATSQIAKGNYLESSNNQIQNQGRVLMQLKRLPSIFGGKSLSNATGCAVECQSKNGDQSCCCAEGQRCVRDQTNCYCEEASK